MSDYEGDLYEELEELEELEEQEEYSDASPSSACENCQDCQGCYQCKNCRDCQDCESCQRCEDCQDCTGCYRCYHCSDSTNLTWRAFMNHNKAYDPGFSAFEELYEKIGYEDMDNMYRSCSEDTVKNFYSIHVYKVHVQQIKDLRERLQDQEDINKQLSAENCILKQQMGGQVKGTVPGTVLGTSQ